MSEDQETPVKPEAPPEAPEVAPDTVPAPVDPAKLPVIKPKVAPRIIGDPDEYYMPRRLCPDQRRDAGDGGRPR